MTTEPKIVKFARHPMQPIELDNNGTARFKKNHIVDHLLELCTKSGLCDMNKLATMQFKQEDREQFAQLIGYSVYGAADLDYMRKSIINKADKQIFKLTN